MVKLFLVEMKTELHFALNKIDMNVALSQIIELNFYIFILSHCLWTLFSNEMINLCFILYFIYLFILADSAFNTFCQTKSIWVSF